MIETTTETENNGMESKMTKFNDALKSYCDAADSILKAHFETNGYTFAVPAIEIKSLGRKYAKLVRTETWDGGEHRENGVHSFVNIETGEILKPATYSAPAKHARGSIYNNNGRDALTAEANVKYLA